MKPVRIGVVGCGNVLEHYAAVAAPLARQGRVELTAACDRDPGKAAEVRARFGIARFSTDARAVVEAPDVDLVLVLTPMQTHAPLAAAALEAGKHVLCEKMLAPTLEEGRRLVAAAARAPGHLLCAPHVLLSPTWRALARRVRAGEIGPVLSARARYGWADPFWQGAWVYQRGAGALFEFAVYNVTSLTGLLGPAVRVAAMTGIAVPEREVGGARVAVETEDNGHLVIDFGRGVLAVVTSGFTLQRYRSPAIELYGAEGTLQMLGDDWAPRGHEIWRNAEGCWTLYDEEAPGWSWADGLGHLVECIEGGQRPATTPEHALHVLEILEKAREASRTGRAQPIESRFAPPAPGTADERGAA